jgi:hypothetical protein
MDRDAPAGLSCRVYRSDDGLAGSPTVEQLIEALGPAPATGDFAAAEPAGSGQPSAQAAQQRADHRPGVPAPPDDQASDSPEEVSPAGCR